MDLLVQWYVRTGNKETEFSLSNIRHSCIHWTEQACLRNFNEVKPRGTYGAQWEYVYY